MVWLHIPLGCNRKSPIQKNGYVSPLLWKKVCANTKKNSVISFDDEKKYKMQRDKSFKNRSKILGKKIKTKVFSMKKIIRDNFSQNNWKEFSPISDKRTRPSLGNISQKMKHEREREISLGYINLP